MFLKHIYSVCSVCYVTHPQFPRGSKQKAILWLHLCGESGVFLGEGSDHKTALLFNAVFKCNQENKSKLFLTQIYERAGVIWPSFGCEADFSDMSSMGFGLQ